ncbi:hypothetical protein L1987_06140 [Smallanthus sonchifolius]|uniref:Uncharacterized protein n=1 Tax=Smallanthus sonchifolius TaxID=185202 RepID=A0ACB9JXF8_9ASTR|nr:hypothetical protein L1987_06140 [Smallanthus sonchifolius]
MNMQTLGGSPTKHCFYLHSGGLALPCKRASVFQEQGKRRDFVCLESFDSELLLGYVCDFLAVPQQAVIVVYIPCLLVIVAAIESLFCEALLLLLPFFGAADHGGEEK